MNITLTVVVAAIVILITALVVITIFGGGIKQVGGIAEAKALCQSQCESTCRATGGVPITWSVPTVRDASGAPQSCQYLLGTATCSKDTGTCSYGGSGSQPAVTCASKGGTCKDSCDITAETNVGKFDCPKVCCVPVFA